MARFSWKWKEVELSESLAQKLALHFQTQLYEAALKSEPANVEWIVALGDLHYNLARTHSLMGQLDRAFQSLSRAIQLGYNKIDDLRADPDLENLKKDSRYQDIIKSLLSRKIGKQQMGG